MHLDVWTLALQTVNLLVLLALLRWLFYRPLIGVIEARRKAVEDERAKAQAALADADRQSQQLAGERAALQASREQLLDAARQDIEREREAAGQRARSAADAALAEAGRQIERERQGAARALFDEAATLASALAGRLLAQAPADGAAGFVEALVSRAEAAPAAQRDGWFVDDTGTARKVTLASAEALDDAVRERAAQRLRALFGAALQVDFAVDAGLIRGAELRFPHGVLAWHWAAEIAAARARMAETAEHSP